MFTIILAIVAATPSPTCVYDPQIVALGFETFDQDMTGGWRALAEQPGCELKAADLLGEYRRKHASQLRILYWHEGQLRAEAGDSTAAVTLMEQSRIVGRDVIGWNAYVDATIAFLTNNRPALARARARLASWPQPGADEYMLAPGKTWPLNLKVVDGFITCFGKSYRVAYGDECRSGIAPTTP